VLGQAGLPVGRILTIEESFADPQARYNRMLLEFDHPVAGPVKATGSPLRFDGEPTVAGTIPPMLGEHTRAILHEMGVDRASVETMIAEGRAVGA
jgi:formyl-CoA transferase